MQALVRFPYFDSTSYRGSLLKSKGQHDAVAAIDLIL